MEDYSYVGPVPGKKSEKRAVNGDNSDDDSVANDNEEDDDTEDEESNTVSSGLSQLVSCSCIRDHYSSADAICISDNRIIYLIEFLYSEIDSPLIRIILVRSII